jgi:DNA mismatch endonuclease (patch repair protein)
MVFYQARVVVFVDGDFWHGWRFPLWSSRLPEFWKAKIDRNRARDRRNFRRLRRAGWTVLRLWEHEIEEDVERCIDRLSAALRRGRAAENRSQRLRGRTV